MSLHLAIDIGASSGRHILGTVENGQITYRELYRFENGLCETDGTLTWDIDRLEREVLRGLTVCHEQGLRPDTVAIDTWGVDYVLLDAAGEPIRPVYAYRDSRTDGVPEQADAVLSRRELYARTGIQSQNFNSVYQLLCDKQAGRLQAAKGWLTIPDYLAYRLTGRRINEYTNASTTGLLNAATNNWDTDLLGQLGIPADLFLPLTKPGSEIGRFSASVEAAVGFNATVVAAPSHDTASAVAACPLSDDSVYLSSGTWSLIGTENRRPILTEEAQNANFTNEGGVEYRYRFLKNIMGMWLFQNIRRNTGRLLNYDEMMRLAMTSRYVGRINPNDPAFVAPDNMIEAVRTALGEPQLPLGDVLNSVYHSLAQSYAESVAQMESICHKTFSRILIVGGGSKDDYLNRLTAQYTGKVVCTGLQEATATGNILAQWMFTQNTDLTAARALVEQSVTWKENRANESI